MEDESLADVAPAAGGRAVVQDQQEEQQQYDTGRGIHWVYHEHHYQTADDTQQTCVPREKLKCWPGKKEEKKVKYGDKYFLTLPFITILRN